jgi:hypothetical protein
MEPTPKICIFYFSLGLNGIEFDVGPYVKMNKLYITEHTLLGTTSAPCFCCGVII